MIDLTQEQLKTILRYDHELGRFFCLVSRGKASVGKMAGYLRKDKYRHIVIDRKRFLEHRLVWLYVYGEMPKNQIDHINHCKEDNRIENLRAVSSYENNRNRSKNKKNASGLSGVSWNKSAGKWISYINSDVETKYLGIFEDYFEAICARKSSELYYGYHENHGG